MSRRAVNWKAVGVLLGAAVVVAIAVHVVHGVQVKRNSGELIVCADRCEAEGRSEAAIDCLAAYVKLRPDDEHTRSRLGLLLSKYARTRHEREQACAFLARAVDVDGAHPNLRREYVRLCLDLHRFGDARPHLERLLQLD
jgi:hypothetical protein